MNLLGSARRWLGQQVENLGGYLGVPETGISERIAGGPTPQTKGVARAQGTGQYGQLPFISPIPLETIGTSRFNVPSTPQQQRQQQGGGQRQPQPQPQPQPSGFPSNPNVNEFFQGWRWTGKEWAPPAGAGGGEIPSAEERARQAAEERMQRFGELVAPVQRDIESYLTSRRPITEQFQEQMTAQGIPTKQALLGGLEKEQTKLGEQLETIPREDIERRKETGMMTAAAERRIRAMEERPIREQLLKTSTAREAERVGLERAFQLVDKYLDVLREEEQRGMEPLQARLKLGEAEFGQEVEALATRLSGFNKDREAQLKQYEMQVQAGLALTKQQQQQAFELQKQEIEHLNTLDEVASKQKGQAWEGNKTQDIQAAQTRILEGASRQDIIGEFGNTLQLPTIEYILDKYNATLAANEQKGGLGEF